MLDYFLKKKGEGKKGKEGKNMMNYAFFFFISSLYDVTIASFSHSFFSFFFLLTINYVKKKHVLFQS
jgi:hypothetical protein